MWTSAGGTRGTLYPLNCTYWSGKDYSQMFESILANGVSGWYWPRIAEDMDRTLRRVWTVEPPICPIWVVDMEHKILSSDHIKIAEIQVVPLMLFPLLRFPLPHLFAILWYYALVFVDYYSPKIRVMWGPTPTPWLTRICFTWILLTWFFKRFPFLT